MLGFTELLVDGASHRSEHGTVFLVKPMPAGHGLDPLNLWIFVPTWETCEILPRRELPATVGSQLFDTSIELVAEHSRLLAKHPHTVEPVVALGRTRKVATAF